MSALLASSPVWGQAIPETRFTTAAPNGGVREPAVIADDARKSECPALTGVADPALHAVMS